MLTDRQALNPHLSRHKRLSSIPAIALFAAAGLCLTPAGAVQADGPNIIRVEEDWELAIATPDPEANAPQVVCVFGPEDPDHNTHAVFELNHGTMPDFAAGGMQLQCWWQNYLLSYRNHPNFSQFEAAIDTVTFTTVTELAGGKLNLEIINGNSITWGAFGGEGYLKISLNTWRQNLNHYDANKSVEHTRVSFGANRVNRLVRREVRYYSANGLESTDSEDKYVHQLLIDQPPG
ncbi:MAG: hypothetical protein AB7U20_00385 [Planctomycetaceae bacterium]